MTHRRISSTMKIASAGKTDYSRLLTFDSRRNGEQVGPDEEKEPSERRWILRPLPAPVWPDTGLYHCFHGNSTWHFSSVNAWSRSPPTFPFINIITLTESDRRLWIKQFSERIDEIFISRILRFESTILEEIVVSFVTSFRRKIERVG